MKSQVPERSRALHDDHRLHRAQGQPERDQGLERPREGGDLGCHSEPQDLGERSLHAISPPGGYALENEKSDDKAKEFVAKLFANVPVFDGGGRGATTTFTQRDVGDALVTFENEIGLLKAEFGDKFDVVYPSLSIEAAPPVAVVETVTAKRGTAEIAKAYLDFLYSPEGQKISCRHGFRPRNEAALAAEAKLPNVKTFRVEDKIGSWAEAQKKHFCGRRRLRRDHDQVQEPVRRAGAV